MIRLVIGTSNTKVRPLETSLLFSLLRDMNSLGICKWAVIHVGDVSLSWH